LVTRIKICGLTRQEDAELAVELGADAVGFVFEPSSPRFIPPESRSFIKNLEPYAHCVAVYGKVETPEPFGCNSIQAIEVIHGALPRRGLPPIFKVMRPVGGDPKLAVAQMDEWRRGHPELNVRGTVLDSFDEQAFGGTGKKVDWKFAATFAELSPVRVILAGGLTPDNVAEAIRTVRPYAVDVSSGVESRPGIKDKQKLRDFIQAVLGA
jgi:phosphoribosylanthranilate isomerase